MKSLSPFLRLARGAAERAERDKGDCGAQAELSKLGGGWRLGRIIARRRGRRRCRVPLEARLRRALWRCRSLSPHNSLTGPVCHGSIDSPQLVDEVGVGEGMAVPPERTRVPRMEFGGR